MSSGLDTLLEAARYLELQEQQNITPSPSPPSAIGGNYHHHHHLQHYNNNYTNINSSNISNNRNINLRHLTSPPISPIYTTAVNAATISNISNTSNNNNSNNINNNNNSNALAGTVVTTGSGVVNRHDFNEFGSMPGVAARNNEGRNEEPCLNGHSNAPSYYVISTSSTNKQNNNNNNINNNDITLYNNNNNNNNNSSNNNNNSMIGNIIPSSSSPDEENENNKSTIYRLPSPLPKSSSNNCYYTNSQLIVSTIKTTASTTSSPRPTISTSTTTTTTTTTKLPTFKKFIPLTPPPLSNRKIIEQPIRRSLSLSSNKIITANGNGITATATTATTATATATIVHNGNVHNVISATTEDSSQSSLNLSSSGYLSGSSANSSVGGCGGPGTNTLNLNSNATSSTTTMSIASPTVATTLPISTPVPNGGSDHQLPIQNQTTGRRRTTSTNSNGSTQRSPCILRAGTREVHNKLEKHRRAHLKECFEQLKLQLQLKDEEKKKTSNLAILGAAYRHVMSLRRKERELEQQVEQLAKDKINAQKKILSLKRELSAKFDNIDLSNIISEGEIINVPGEKDSLSDSLSLSTSGRSGVRYSSSSSLSSGTTISSPLGSGIQTALPTAISPVISMPPNSSPGSPHLKSISPVTSSMPLSLTTKNLCSALTRSSPTPSTPSPSLSSSGVSSSSSPITSSTSPPIVVNNVNTSIALKIPNVPNGIKLCPTSSSSSAASPSTLGATVVNISGNNDHIVTDIPITTTATVVTAANSIGMPISFNSQQQNLQIANSCTQKELITGKNGVCRKSSADTRESSPPGVILTNNGTNLQCSKETIKLDKVFDESEQPTKVIKLFNGIALAPVDKDNKILSSTPLALSQVVGGGGLVVSPFPMISSPGLRVIGTNGLATIELSTPTVQQSHNRNHHSHTTQSPTTTTVTTPSGAQLHKLLVSGTTATSGNNHMGNNGTINHATNVASELARLPGGAELNILPAGANGTTTLYRGNGKLAIVNNSITLKGADATATSGRAVHVVTPLQSGGTPISSLTPIVVSQGQPVSNLAHIIASSPQLAGKVNLSVGGQALPIISTQYLSSMKPMVVTIASNATPTLSSVPPTQTSATIVTGTANGNHS